jgi:RNA polymerase sigma factor (sigma-70 family)
MLESYALDAEMRCDFWARFCTNHYQPGVDFARWRVGNIDEAREVVHDSVVRVLRLLPDPDRIGDQKNYWLKIIQNRCYELLRKRNAEAARTISRDAPSMNDDGEEMLPLDPVDPSRDPELNLLVNEENELLLKALEMHSADFTEREKALLALRFAGYTNAEIAGLWGEDVKVIRTDVNAVMAKLRYRLLHSTK